MESFHTRCSNEFVYKQRYGGRPILSGTHWVVWEWIKRTSKRTHSTWWKAASSRLFTSEAKETESGSPNEGLSQAEKNSDSWSCLLLPLESFEKNNVVSKTPWRNIWDRPDSYKRLSFKGSLVNTSVKAHKALLAIPPCHKSTNMNRASTCELTPIANFMKHMSQQLIAKQSKLRAHEHVDSLHVTKQIAELNNYIHTCLATRTDTPEEGEIQSFRLKNRRIQCFSLLPLTLLTCTCP